MLRETYVREQPTYDDESVWPVLNHDPLITEPVPAVVDGSLPFRAALATPDVPASLGVIMFATYMALIGALALATAGPGESKLVLAIAALFVVAFFTVPRLLFAQEPQAGPRPHMDQFLAQGMNTYTGHCPGVSALVQMMMIVPVLLTLGVLIIALGIVFIG